MKILFILIIPFALVTGDFKFDGTILPPAEYVLKAELVLDTKGITAQNEEKVLVKTKSTEKGIFTLPPFNENFNRIIHAKFTMALYEVSFKLYICMYLKNMDGYELSLILVREIRNSV